MKDEYLNAAKLRAGDVLLSHGRRAHLRFIAWATESSYSHAAIYSEPYQVFEAVRDGVGFSGLKPIKVERSPSGDRILCSTKGYTKLGVFRLPDPFRPAKYRDEAAVRLDLHRVLLPLNGLDYKQLEHFVDVHTRLSWIPKGLRKTLLKWAGGLLAGDKDKILAGFFCSELAVSALSSMGMSMLKNPNKCPEGLAPGDLANAKLTHLVEVTDAVCSEDASIPNDPFGLLSAQYRAQPYSMKRVVHATREMQMVTESVLEEMRKARKR